MGFRKTRMYKKSFQKYINFEKYYFFSLDNPRVIYETLEYIICNLHLENKFLTLKRVHNEFIKNN